MKDEEEGPRFVVNDYLDHVWTEELVSFPVSGLDISKSPAVKDEQGKILPCQIECKSEKICFVVDKLQPLGTRYFELVEGKNQISPFTINERDEVVELGNNLVSIRIPAANEKVKTFPAPILGIKRKTEKDWIGQGRLFLSDYLTPKRIKSSLIENGSLWLTWQLVYECRGGQQYIVDLKLFADSPYVEITEESKLCREGHWEFSAQTGLNPDFSWTHPHQVSMKNEVRMEPLPFADAHLKDNLGAIQMPNYSGIWIADDYYYYALLNQADKSKSCIAVAGINGGFWDYPYENQIDIQITSDKDAYFRASIKSGHRRWLLFAIEQQEITKVEPFYENVIHRKVKKYETPLDKVKNYILEWQETVTRPFLVADQEQLKHARKLTEEYPPLHEYVASLNPDLPGDYTYYHAGTHRVFEPDYRNDPAVLYVTTKNADERKRQARFLKDVVMEGLKSRREAMLKYVGHCDNNCASINVGRGLRPWAVLYDFAEAEGVFTEQEKTLAKATFAFFCYKIYDPDYWPADHLVFRDDHPRSAHRTHWFPGRQHDWAFYNIDNIPHNFHGDLWSALGCMAMAFPNHPESRKWVDRTLEFWECELTQWVFPEGAWLESTTYTLNSMKDYLLYCRALANSHIRNYFTDERLQRIFRFVAETLLPYDERIKACSMPVLGDASYPSGFAYVLGWMAGLAKETPEYAGMLNNAWKKTGEYLTEPGRFGLNFCDFLFLDPFIEDDPLPVISSKWYHGLGAMLRHGAGTDKDIYMFIKAGVIYSHFHEPEGNFILWWHNRPLCDEFGVQYGEGVNEVANHNCIEIRGDGDSCCYNKGDITRFVATDAFDHTIVESPIHQAFLRENEMIWGFKGEVGPNGWHRRHFLFVKPYYVMVYDDLECPYPTTYHLSSKAVSYQHNQGRISYKGELGIDLEFYIRDLKDRKISFSEFDVKPRGKQQFVPPKNFYHQLQLHIDSDPYQDCATILVPHSPENDVTISEAEDYVTISIDDQIDRATLLKEKKRIETDDFHYQGRAGVIRTQGKTLTLIQAEGTSIGLKNQLSIDGDGPYNAVLTDDGKLTISCDGIARWLTISGVPFQTATCNGKNVSFETLAEQKVRLYIKTGKQEIELKD